MKTILIVEQAGEFTEYQETHIFNGDMRDACKLAFKRKIFSWAKSVEEIEEAILEGDGICCYTTDEITCHSKTGFHRYQVIA